MRRSPSIAAVLSFVWPGLGQLYLRRPRRAAFFAVPALVLLALAIREALQGPVTLAFSMLDARYAASVAALALLSGAWRVWAMLDAYVVAAGVGAHAGVVRLPRPAAALMAVLLVLILAMHSLPAFYAYSMYDTDRQIAQPVPSDAAWFPPETPDPSEMPELETPGPTATPEPGVTPDPNATPEPTDPGSTTLPYNPGRVTILLTGVDFGPGRSHSLTDTMLLVSFDTVSRRVGMVSVPRDTTMFPLYWNGGTLGKTFKLNALVTGVANHWFASPDDPYTTLQKEIGYIVGIRADYYAVIDLQGFTRMVDMVGGVDVYNPRTFSDPTMDKTWQQGRLHLDGDAALLYVRSRHGTNDYARASRQQDVMVALEKKLTTPQMIVRLPDFLGVARDTIRTNYPLDRAKDMAALAQDIPDEAIYGCVLGPPYSWHPDSSTTRGSWTSRLNMDRVAALSVYMFGKDSRYYGRARAAPCG